MLISTYILSKEKVLECVNDFFDLIFGNSLAQSFFSELTDRSKSNTDGVGLRDDLDTIGSEYFFVSPVPRADNDASLDRDNDCSYFIFEVRLFESRMT